MNPPTLGPLETWFATVAGNLVAFSFVVIGLVFLWKRELMKAVEFMGIAVVAVAFIYKHDVLVTTAQSFVDLITKAG